jgi:NADPH:quinone reductase-like Zn-dependent oxidoreductase
MKAIVQHAYGPPDVLQLVDIDEPEPGDDEVLVRVRASSINMADVDYLLGRPWVTRLGMGLTRPKNVVPGTDMAGVVEAVGAGVVELSPGDEVFADLTDAGSGAWAELVSVPQVALTKMPAGVDFEQAAAVPSSGVLALQGLRARREIREGDQVLINGAAGNVGPFAVQIAKSFGAEVTGVDRTDKLELLRSIGADHVIDYTRADFTRGERRYDFVLDMVSSHPVGQVLRALNRGGAYVVIGGPLHRYFFAMTFGHLLALPGGKKTGMPMWEANKAADVAELAAMLAAGTLSPFIDRRFSLAEVPDALRYVDEGSFQGKVVITI